MSVASEVLERLLLDSGAILKGHFLLTSGRHSGTYFEKFRVLERPDVLSTLCAETVAHFRNEHIQLVAGPTTGGIIIAFEVARQLEIPALYVESEGGIKALRRGAAIPHGARTLVVDDVLTTGRSVRETIDVVRGAGGVVAGVGVLIDRSEAPLDFGCALHASYRVEAVSYPPDSVPEELMAIPITKPGTRPS